jgi:hypothetical protein
LDKKIFTVEASVTSRNNRWLAYDPDDVPVGSSIRFLASVSLLQKLAKICTARSYKKIFMTSSCQDLGKKIVKNLARSYQAFLE